ncbi:uncharacterized protein LOC131941662 [Physella acuta]|uniref:uncharacterized protein LOC131941662 n=1 Tax=Physella acuta TaxID=109671 RepID=UPI0027DDE785|nr:uncharacterized protein LOC131941662 [Physella acuta]
MPPKRKQERIEDEEGIPVKIYCYASGGRATRWYNPAEKKPGTSKSRKTGNFTTNDNLEMIQSDAEDEEDEQKESAYTINKNKRLAVWQDLRAKFIAVGLAKLERSFKNCTFCSCPIDTGAHYRCDDCAPFAMEMCGSCLLQQHAYPHLHMFSIWQDGTFMPCSQNIYEHQIWQIPHDCKGEKTTSQLIIVDQKGREHIRKIMFCSCEEQPVTLLKLGLWAGSPMIPKVAYHVELFVQMRSLLLEGHVPIKTFCSSLEFNSPPEARRISQFKNIYSSCFLEAFEEFKHYMYGVEHPVEFVDGLDDGTQCPACFNASTKIICLDADFQLVRKASAGRQWETPTRQVFFHQQDAVETFVSTYKEESVANDQCSDFQAGNNLRSKSKNVKLSDKGIFGSVCRHEIPNKFASLKHGERLAYPVYFLEKLVDNFQGSKLIISYDIACKLNKHLQKNNPALLKKCQMMVPIFHCYGHQRQCQILYHPRRIEGVGLTDGEGIERLWSYLGKFSKICKEMKPETRQDMLSDGLLHFSERKKKNIGHSLVARLGRATIVKETAIKSLAELQQLHPDINQEIISKWTKEEVESVQKDISMKKSAKKDSFLLIQNFAIERHFLKEQIRKYARGQSIAKRISRQLSTNAKKLQKAIDDHNKSELIPVTFNQVINLSDSSWVQNYGIELLKRQTIDLNNIILRCHEEDELIKKEMISVLNFYELQINHINEACRIIITKFRPRLFLDMFRLKLYFNFLLDLFTPFLSDLKFSKFAVVNEHDFVNFENSEDILSIDSGEVDANSSMIEDEDDEDTDV